MTNYVPGRPDPSEYAPHFQGYIDHAANADDVCAALETQPNELRTLVGGLDTARAGYRYAEGKWSIREVIGHVTDSERVFGYRAMCIARGDTQSLPGFDENVYAANSPAERRRSEKHTPAPEITNSKGSRQRLQASITHSRAGLSSGFLTCQSHDTKPMPE